MPELQNISTKHVAIMDYMIANPTAKMGDVAKAFEISPTWLSIIVHSDLFQKELKEKQAELFIATVVPLRQKVNAAAHLAIEKTAEVIHNSSPTTDKAFIVNTTMSLLQSLDYGNKGGGGGQGNSFGGDGTNVQNNYYVNPGDLQEARALMKKAQEAAERGVIQLEEQSADSATKRLPPGESS